MGDAPGLLRAPKVTRILIGGRREGQRRRCEDKGAGGERRCLAGFEDGGSHEPRNGGDL